MTTETLKNPSIAIPSELVGIDKAIEHIRGRLAGIVWLDKAFGRAWTKPRVLGGKTVQEPLLYQGTGEYYPALPNDALRSYSFFRVNSPRTTTNFAPNLNTGGAYRFTDSVDLIVWVDLKAINATADFIFTELLIADVMNKLNNLRGPQAAVVNIYDDKVEDIFKGYDLREIGQNLLLYPYKGFRIEMKLTYEFECVPAVAGAILAESEGGNQYLLR